MAAMPCRPKEPMPDRRRNPGWGLGRRRLRLATSGQVRLDARRGYAGVEAVRLRGHHPAGSQGSATGVFDTLSDRLTSALAGLRGKGRLSDADIDATAREIRIALLEADVALPVVRQFVAQIKERAKGSEVSGALNPAQQVIKIVNEELISILGGATRRLELAKIPPTVIMLAGLQGSGKTTLAGKLALWLRSQGHTPLLVAADLQRPNAVTQLQIVGQQAGVQVYAPEPGNGVGDPVDVSRRGVAEARARQYDIVVVDTAGRLGIDAEMMRQAVDIRDAVRPNEILFVIDAMIGQDAVSTSEAFRDGVGFSGVVLTKLDGDARGGAALSVRQVTGAPILFASNGERLEDFDVFHPDRMASRILGMGDLLTLIEQAEQAFDAEQAEQTAAKIGSGELTLEDFLEQMQAIRKMGPIANLLGMLPGAAGMKEQLAQVDDKQLDRLQAIIRGMTPAERADPKIINASRRQRIARGSGVAVSEVNQLVERFFEARKMMQQMAGRFGFGAGPGRRGRKGRKGKKVKGRGPTPPRTPRALPGGLPPGLPGGMPPGMPDLSELSGLDQLPPGFDPSKLRFPKK
ncbi:MAG: signal recognition particle subunit [Pseudonocardiales bacterium]|nr:signal recognition particle subunit [Pseudonocardiales bacterium]